MTAIQLRDGPLIAEDALLLALKLEAAGHALSQRDGKLVVTEGSRLTAVDREAIARQRLHLLAFVAYCEEGHQPV